MLTARAVLSVALTLAICAAMPVMLILAARVQSLRGTRPCVKDCPVCGQRSAPTQFTCRSCGYHYPGYISPLHYMWIGLLTLAFWYVLPFALAALSR